MRLQPLGHLSAPCEAIVLILTVLWIARELRPHFIWDELSGLASVASLLLLTLFGLVQLLGQVVLVGHLFNRVQLPLGAGLKENLNGSLRTENCELDLPRLY